MVIIQCYRKMFANGRNRINPGPAHRLGAVHREAVAKMYVGTSFCYRFFDEGPKKRKYNLEVCMNSKKLFEVREILSMIPMSRAGLYLACGRGDVPCVRVGRRLFIPAWWLNEITCKPKETSNQS